MKCTKCSRENLVDGKFCSHCGAPLRFMIKNKILEQIQRGEKALGMTITEPSEELVELAGHMGLDFISLDGQHSTFSPEVVESLCRIADGYGITPTMRVPDQYESTILRYLDRGVRLIVVPNLQTKEQAEALVRNSYFAPKGLRSETSIRTIFNMGGQRRKEGDRAERMADINAVTMVVPQLESTTALENLDGILEVEGIDYFAGGAGDLAQSMGLPGQPSHPEVQRAWRQAMEKIRVAGKGLPFEDSIESIRVIDVVYDSVEELLEKHGRKPQISW
jgi:2-keto-3-deoxy-L-rhamnonate aldolase RhmA